MNTELHNYINIHTHHQCNPNTTCLINLFAQNLLGDNLDSSKYYSIGLHPWHINDESEMVFEKNIRRNLIHPNIIAIGETGIDQAIELSIEVQRDIFERHVIISEEYSKPIIVHCVRAYNELISTQKKFKTTMPWILHGFNGNIQTTNQLLKHNFYFGFGRGIKNLSGKLLESLQQIPLNRIFLETDDTHYEICEVYKKYSEVMNLELEQVVKQMDINFKRCFGFDHNK